MRSGGRCLVTGVALVLAACGPLPTASPAASDRRPSPLATTSQVTPSPSATEAGVRWARLTSADTAAFADPLRSLAMDAVAGSSKGFVAIMTDSLGGSATWYSADGIGWGSAAIAADGSAYASVAALADGTFVVGGVHAGRPAVFLADGASWTPVELLASGGGTVASLARAGTDLLALVGPFDEGGPVALMRSTDGRRWTTVSTLDGVDGAQRLAAGPAGIVLTAMTSNGPGVFWSPDGRAWTFTPLGFPGEALSDLTAMGGRFVTIDRGTAWTSTDGRTWSPTTLFQDDELHSLVALTADERGIAALDRGSDGESATIWRSAGGASWAPEPLPLVDGNTALPRALAIGGSGAAPARLVVVGAGSREWWRGTVAATVWIQGSAAAGPSPAGSTRPCPAASNVDVIEVLDRSPEDRRACFASRTVTFVAFVNAPEGGSGPSSTLIQGLEGMPGHVAYVYAAPTGLQPAPFHWYRITGRFPDLTALCSDPSTCEDQFAITNAEAASPP